MQDDKPKQPARFYTALTVRDLARPLRAVLLPLGVSTLVAGFATAQAADAQPPSPPRSLEDYQRIAFYKHLNAEVQRDPKVRGTILVIDPTPYPTVRSMLEDVEPKLKSMLPPWSFHPFQPPVAQMLRPLRLAAEFEDSQRKLTQRKVNAGAIMDTGGITGRSYRPTDKQRSSADFICMAVGTRATVTLTDFTEDNYSKFAVFLARYTPAFQQAVNNANGNGKNLVLHELGHCVHGFEQRDAETSFAYTRRVESGADAFEMLMRIRNNEPDMLNKLETNVQWRRANSISARNYDTTHDTSATLRLVVDDLRKNPQMALELQRMTLSQIDARASAYADRAQLQEYPHLADKSLSKTAALAKTAEVDSLIDMSSRYISGKMVVAGYDETPVRLPVSAAVGMLQRAHTAENYLRQPPYSRVKQAITQLRQLFPDEMKQAETIFADELRNYPPLAIAKSPRAPLQPPPAPAKPHHKPGPNHKTAPKPGKLHAHGR